MITKFRKLLVTVFTLFILLITLGFCRNNIKDSDYLSELFLLNKASITKNIKL